VLNDAGQSDAREFHVYDSFEGLPEKSQQDNNAAGVDFEAGKLYVSKKEFMQQFRSAGLLPPIAHKNWFNELTPDEVPGPIAFAFLDGDFYDSIISSLRLVWPKMAEGGTIVIDDYKRDTLPGVERAIKDFFQGKHIKSLRGEANKAIIEL
jgi:O-methyltransferase